MTDHGNVSRSLFTNTMKAARDQPIIGWRKKTYWRAEKSEGPRGRAAREKKPTTTDSAWRKLRRFRNLSRLTSKAFNEGFYYKPRIDKEPWRNTAKGLNSALFLYVRWCRPHCSPGGFDEAATAASRV